MRKILVLDDQQDSLTTLRAILEYRDYGTALLASEPGAAIQMCADDYGIELLVCDIVLRAYLTGAETACRIHQSRRELPILFTSGTALEGLDETDFQMLSSLLSARVDFLQKPF